MNQFVNVIFFKSRYFLFCALFLVSSAIHAHSKTSNGLFFDGFMHGFFAADHFFLIALLVVATYFFAQFFHFLFFVPLWLLSFFLFNSHQLINFSYAWGFLLAHFLFYAVGYLLLIRVNFLSSQKLLKKR